MSQGGCVFDSVQVCHVVFRSGGTFYTPPAVDKSSSCHKPSSTFDVVSVSNQSHANKYGVLFLCGFDLHFPND